MSKRATRGVLQEIRLRISFARPGAIEILKDVLTSCGIARQELVEVAGANLKRNGCRGSGLAVADIHHYPSRRRYDLVAANLVTRNLVKSGRKLVSLVRPDKYLAVSGISLENVSLLKESFRNYPLRSLKIIEGREWAAVSKI